MLWEAWCAANIRLKDWGINEEEIEVVDNTLVASVLENVGLFGSIGIGLGWLVIGIWIKWVWF